MFDHCLGLARRDVMILGWMKIHWDRGNVQELMDRGEVLAEVGSQWLGSC